MTHKRRDGDLTNDANARAIALLEAMQRFRAEGHPSSVVDRLPGDEQGLRDLAVVLDKIGIEAYNADGTERAHDAFYLLFLCRLRIVERHPGVRADIRDFASAEDLLGAVMLDVGNIQGAEKLIEESLRYRRSLLDDDPGRCARKLPLRAVAVADVASLLGERRPRA